MYHAATPPRPAPRPLPALPCAARAQVWLDFDGTLSRTDLIDDLIARYSRNDSWRLVEERWRAGLIGSRDCLRQQLALLDISPEQLGRELAQVELDPGALPLFALLERAAVPVAILSDGVESFIRAILGRAGVPPLPIRANAATHARRAISLQCRSEGSSCVQLAAHCKCASRAELARPGRSCIYIGDGRSDLCAARSVEVVFAKGALATALTLEERPFRSFGTLLDVRSALAEAWEIAR